MNPIYIYTNYRQYLRDYFLQSKRESKYFSYRKFADKAGFKARDYILRVINGTRNLSKSGIYMLSKAMKLSEKEAGYFENLVGFNQARTNLEKDHFYRKVADINKYSSLTKLRNDQYEYFSTWYHSVVRSLVPVIDFNDDFAKLGKLFTPSISEKQARDSVMLLLRLGMLKKLKAGNYAVTDPVITTGDEVVSLAVANFHKECMDLAKRSIDVHESESRNISGMTMSISEQGFKKIKEEILSFQERITAIATADSGEDRVYQLNNYFFPLAKTKAKL